MHSGVVCELKSLVCKRYYQQYFIQNVSYRGIARNFIGGITEATPSGDHRLYMVYTAALPHVSVGSVVLSRHVGPY